MMKLLKSAGIFLLTAAMVVPSPLLSPPAASAEYTAEYTDVRRDVPYVPTPEEVVQEMLRMAGVTREDLVYDLGCGDGRIVITAARDLGARGVGVDIDPQRIRESVENAERAGVGDRVAFMQEDLFRIDFSEASVLTLYLLQDVNLRLRPRILSDLRPGSRVVSHDFHMGEWEPDAVARVGSHSVYYWMVPADARGSWEWVVQEGVGNVDYRLDLDQRFQQVTGSLTAGPRVLPISEMTLEGDRLTFVVSQGIEGRIAPVLFEGKINGNAIEGTMRPRAGGEAKPWRAQREAARASLE